MARTNNSTKKPTTIYPPVVLHSRMEAAARELGLPFTWLASRCLETGFEHFVRSERNQLNKALNGTHKRRGFDAA